MGQKIEKKKKWYWRKKTKSLEVKENWLMKLAGFIRRLSKGE